MEGLFYSKDEKILFWVTGYCWVDSTQNITEQISGLNEKRKEFLFSIKPENQPEDAYNKIKTYQIQTSRRYKYMRVFWLEGIKPNQVPEEAYNITSSDWTMQKWLEN